MIKVMEYIVYLENSKGESRIYGIRADSDREAFEQGAVMCQHQSDPTVAFQVKDETGRVIQEQHG